MLKVIASLGILFLTASANADCTYEFNGRFSYGITVTQTNEIHSCKFSHEFKDEDGDSNAAVWIYRCHTGKSFSLNVEKGNIYNSYGNIDLLDRNGDPIASCARK